MTQNFFEKEIGAELKRLASEKALFEFRLYDTKSFRQVSEKIYCIRQPCDFQVIYNGITYFLELKSSKNPNSFSFNFIPDHQKEMMSKAEKAGHLYVTVRNKLIRLQTVKSYFLISNRSYQRHYRCYAVRVNTLIDFIKNSKKKSIKWDELKEISLEIPRVGQSWDLRELFGLY